VAVQALQSLVPIFSTGDSFPVPIFRIGEGDPFVPWVLREPKSHQETSQQRHVSLSPGI
jgi:hypothetical protein